MTLSKYKKIIFFSVSRSELDLITPLIKKLKKKNKKVKSIFIISGTHLSKLYGKSEKSIDKSIKINEKIHLNLKDTSKLGIVIIFEKLFSKFRKILTKFKPNLVLLVGDRYETLCLALTAKLLDIKILHLHGGEKTEGSIDDIWRHVISKLSDFHSVISPQYKKRLVQLGEQPKNIFNFGSVGSNNIRKSFKENEKTSYESKYLLFEKKLLITYNSLSNDINKGRKELKNILASLKSFKQFGIFFTLPNHDLDANFIKKEIIKFCRKNSNAFYADYLGKEKFIYYLKKSDLFIGNSSSGIIEAPVAKVPTLNIGDRQKGRAFSPSIFKCSSSKKEINNKIKLILKLKQNKKIKYKDIFYKKDVIKKITDLISKILNNKILSNKSFYDLKI